MRRSPARATRRRAAKACPALEKPYQTPTYWGSNSTRVAVKYQDYYQILGVPRHADESEIKQAYRMADEDLTVEEIFEMTVSEARRQEREEERTMRDSEHNARTAAQIASGMATR